MRPWCCAVARELVPRDAGAAWPHTPDHDDEWHWWLRPVCDSGTEHAKARVAEPGCIEAGAPRKEEESTSVDDNAAAEG